MKKGGKMEYKVVLISESFFEAESKEEAQAMFWDTMQNNFNWLNSEIVVESENEE